MRIAVVDSGPLVAAANRADPDHEACLKALGDPTYQLVIPAMCIAEVSYLIGRRQGSEIGAKFLRGLESFDVRAPMPEDWVRIAEIVTEYAGFSLGGTDASVVCLAERLETDLVVTLDRRHFQQIRPRHTPRFRILPSG